MSGSQRVAILTGGSGGLVPGIAEQLANAGFTIVLTARGETALEAAAARLRESVDTPVVAIASDARDATATKALAEKVIDRFGRIDVLVNAAASSTPIGGAIEDVDIDALIADVDVKVGGYLRYAQAVVPAMKRQGAGHIVNIGGLTGRSSDTLSGLRNAAVAHLTKVLSDQLGRFRISVNVVNPGIVRTPHLDELFAEMAEECDVTAKDIEAEFVQDIPTGEILSPAQVGQFIAFLANAQSPSITGQSLTIDGGYSRGVYL
ncbi:MULTISPECIES: SDR family oxidoreductase [unclassified Sphingobium]|uniref:SDR family oxidoreductase n=1 Tax=unclassified Sphingobium TaxID=2611147 RepID=UPI000D165DB8|nr:MULTISPECIES: SDR family oxidoreductase [unclassified Sphingobium]MBG6120833.1 NAD(P)-dependent dehydrogenase (short-subunit alcohol dehydrogenase family) [Sphingobium sp. JAI105]PSO09833.1 short-chain dehydrogenase [Sphingobium sp. AEW4]TWC98494.1 NAD(P)-dependent dehydrogenase (short-subunit alcohol dehydrogenase family) [Sphingobium sp. AEW010]TWD18312.1 NAD(P)-dependent dehydrogenase (short-subunit alcohol dehydrogenase family) [Sphingobium sp. AEW013]TWD20853.1 NAD(P)-dependent dehydro